MACGAVRLVTSAATGEGTAAKLKSPHVVSYEFLDTAMLLARLVSCAEVAVGEGLSGIPKGVKVKEEVRRLR